MCDSRSNFLKFLSREELIHLRDEIINVYFYAQQEYLDEISISGTEEEISYAQGQFDMINKILADINMEF